MEPARAWKPGAHCGMSRIAPSVMTPRQPSALCTVLLTSPQKQPWPTFAPSRSWMTLIVGPAPVPTYS